MLKAVTERARTIRILSDDTDVFVFLVYWTSRMRVVAKIQKVQSASRYPRTVRLRYSVVPLWKRKNVIAQAPRDRYTRSRSSARSA